MATLRNTVSFSTPSLTKTCPAEKTWATKKVREINSHTSWHKNINQLQSEALLSGQAPFTFLLRSGQDSHHYFISYVTPQLSIEHVPLSIEFSLKSWLYRNGGNNIRENLDDLIVCVLHCKTIDCKPLHNLKAAFYFS